jgi:hypothetical protein
MLTDIHQKAFILIVGLFLGASLTVMGSFKESLLVTAGTTLFWALCSLPSILSFGERLYSPAPKDAAPKPRPTPLCHVYDPVTNTMTALRRDLLTAVLH